MSTQEPESSPHKRRAENAPAEKEPKVKKVKDGKKKKILAMGGVSMFGGKDLFGGKNPFAARKQEQSSSSEEEEDNEEEGETEGGKMENNVTGSDLYINSFIIYHLSTYTIKLY